MKTDGEKCRAATEGNKKVFVSCPAHERGTSVPILLFLSKEYHEFPFLIIIPCLVITFKIK